MGRRHSHRTHDAGKSSCPKSLSACLPGTGGLAPPVAPGREEPRIELMGTGILSLSKKQKSSASSTTYIEREPASCKTHGVRAACSVPPKRPLKPSFSCLARRADRMGNSPWSRIGGRTRDQQILFQSDDAKERAGAYVEKRTATFTRNMTLSP